MIQMFNNIYFLKGCKQLIEVPVMLYAIYDNHGGKEYGTV